jgi:surface protein
MSTLPTASLIRSTTFNDDLINLFSVSKVYTATFAPDGTGKDYTNTVALSDGYNTTNYKVFSSVVSTSTLSQYLHPVIITSRTTGTFGYSIYVASGFGTQDITIDFSVRYYLPQVLTIDSTFTLYSSDPLLKKYAIIVTWTNLINTASISSYTINITANGYNETYWGISNTSTSYIIDGLIEYTDYTISITAINSVGSNRPVRTNYTIGNNFNFNYKTTNTGITRETVLGTLPFITGTELTITPANVYVNIQTVDTNKKLVSVEIPPKSFTFTDNTTTTDGLSFQSLNYYFFGNVTEINILFFGNNGTQSKIIPLSRGGTQFGLLGAVNTDPDSSVPFSISNSDKPYILPNTYFTFTFRKLTNFNSDLSKWGSDISNVTDMGQMFLRSSLFNQDISSWNVSNVKEMSYMFDSATAFNNGDIGNNAQHSLTWTTNALTSVAGMFNSASNFNQDIRTFVLTNVTGSLQFMFFKASSFNQDISSWDVSNVKNMSQMFQQASAFNQNLDAWGTRLSKVTNMSQMFQQASAFNQNLNVWSTISNVTNMNYMFLNATVFNNGGGLGDTTNPMTSWVVNSNVTHVDFATNSRLYHTNHPTGNIQPDYWDYGVLNGSFTNTTPLPVLPDNYYRTIAQPTTTVANWALSGNGIYVCKQNNVIVPSPFPNGDICLVFQIYPTSGSFAASISQNIHLYAGSYKFNSYLVKRESRPLLPLNITIIDSTATNIFTLEITNEYSDYSAWTQVKNVIPEDKLKFTIETPGTYTLSMSAVSPTDTSDHFVGMQGISIKFA